MIQARTISLSFGDQTIFDHISFTIDQYDRIGLVGRNGSGKTTLLSAILKPHILNEGSISIQSKKKIAYMPQEVVLESSRSILDETCTTFTHMHALQQELASLETQIETNDPEIIERYAVLQEQLQLINPETLMAKTKKMLMGLGFSVPQFEQPVSALSVGWKMRIVLAKLLLQEADFYLFDEPTNHLDLMAKEWFFDFLKQASFGFILICHERYFLDSLCEKILELEQGNATWYTGNYSKYIVQKEHNLQLLESAQARQQKEIQRKQATIERFRAKASKAKMAQSMEKALAKVERIELPRPPKKVHFNFPPIQPSGEMVINVENVSHHFNDRTLFKNVSFKVERHQKVALIAPNGVGKTTLFNLIARILPLQHGTVTFGHQVTCALFAQDQNKALNRHKTILENIKELCPATSEQKIRSFLGAFLFSGEDVFKKVQVLSGGEKNRVGMISVLLQQANLLLLDEPTNHLDIPSKEILLHALQEFQGTLLFVSHDRDFINDLATDIVELTPHGAYHYKGNYDAYLYQRPNVVQPEPREKVITRVSKERPHDERKKAKRLEEKIAKIEQQIKKLNESFVDKEYGTPAFNTAQEQLKRLEQELRTLETEWDQVYQG